MDCGLFGKLPAKRDFVASNAARQFLDIWEPWLQASVATSRQLLGDHWNAAYNRAPIWRFWLGSKLCGEALVGAVMPSVDGVGRSFPLTIFTGEGDLSLLPPELDSNDAWYEGVEAVLLDALDPTTEFEAVAAAMKALEPPILHARNEDMSGISLLPSGAVLIRDFDRELALAFRAARRFDHRSQYAGRSFWWTVGGVDYPPLALCLDGMPPPEQYASMLTGVFGAEAANSEKG